MEVTEVPINDILSCRKFVVKSYEIDAFIIGYHVYKTAWTSGTREELCGVMESTN